MVESASKTRLHMVSALKAGVLETIAIDGDFYVKEGAGAWKQLIKGNPAEVAKALVESAAFSLEDVNKDLKTQKVTDKGLVKFGERSTLQYAYGAGKNEINIFIGANDGRLVRMEFPSGAGSVGWEYPATLAITAPAIQ